MRTTSLLIGFLFGIGCPDAAPAQTTWETIPAGFDVLPGNAAAAMPGRWNWGTMQVIFEDSLFANLQGRAITRLRLRKPARGGEAAYAARTATFEVSLGPSPNAPQNMSGNRFDQNDTRPNPTNPVLPIAFAQRAFSIPATPPLGVGDALGATMIDLPLDQPVTIPANTHVLLEWRSIDTAFQVFGDGWVDAVWTRNGADTGLALPVGQHGCGGRGATPMRLEAAPGSEFPAFGQNSTVRLTGAVPEAPSAVLLGIDPVGMSAPTTFGQTLSIPPFVAGCHFWTPFNFVIDSGSTTLSGGLSHTFDFPPTNDPVLQGARLGVQVLVVEQSQVSASNGLVLWMDSVGVGDKVAMGVWPEDTNQFWLPLTGLTPVVGFGY